MSRPEPRVLVTAFEPFHGSRENASLAALSLLASPEPWAAEIDLRTATLPVETDRVAQVLLGLLASHDPSVVVLLGESGKAERVTLERLAVNLRDFRIADNVGAQPVDLPVEAGGPAGVWSSLPVKACQARVQAAGGAVELSMSAGTYVCNQALYIALRWASGVVGDPVDGSVQRQCVGFVHVPSLPSQVARGERSVASLSAAHSAAAVREIVAAAVDSLAGDTVDNPAKY